MNCRRLWRQLSSIFLLIGASVIFSACSILDQKTKAGLQVITGDAPASLFLDGQYLDKTPFIGKDIKPGTYTLKIQPDNSSLVAYETPVTLSKGLLTVVTWKPGARPELGGGVIYEMSPISNHKGTELTINTVPDGAIITIKGKNKQFSPLTLTDIAAGQTDFEVSLPSYDSQENTVNLTNGYRTTVTVKLAKSQVIDVNTIPSTSAATKSASLTSTPATSSATEGNRLASASAQLQPTGTKVKIKPTGYSPNGKEVLRVRAAAEALSKEVGQVDVGGIYPFSSVMDGWYNITFNNQTGWVNGQYVTVIP